MSFYVVGSLSRLTSWGPSLDAPGRDGVGTGVISGVCDNTAVARKAELIGGWCRPNDYFKMHARSLSRRERPLT